jgi:outer membrane receptor for ferrienterochelin and colicins
VVAGADVKAGTNTDDGGELLLPQAYGGAGLGKFRFILGGNYKSRNGWDYDGEAPDDGDDLSQQCVNGQAAIDISKDHSISFGGYYNNFERTGMRDLQNTYTERDATDESSEVFVRYDGTFAEHFNLMLQAYHAEYSSDVDLTPATTDKYYLLWEEYKRTQYEGRFTAKFNDMVSATLGGEYREDTRAEDDISPEYNTENAAGFGQLDMLFFERLNIVAGLRLDDHSEFGSEWSPRVALSFMVNEYLRLKGGYGHGFRAPIPYELYVTSYKKRGKDTYLPNSELEPETAQSFEVGLQSSLPVAKGLDMELTYFYNDIDNMIEAALQSTSGSGKSAKSTYKYENITAAETSGLEFLGSLKLPCGWKLGAGLTYLSTENKETGEQLASQPEFKGNLNAQWHIASLGLRARLSYTFYSGVEDGSGNSLDDYSILDAYLAKDIYDGLQVYAGMKNMLDEETGDYNIQPAFVYLGVKWDY